MAELVFSPAILRKLDNVYDYITNTLKAPNAATLKIAQILKGLDILKANPDIGPLLSSRIDTVPPRFAETRFLVCGDYIVIYDHIGTTVQLLVMYHSKQDAFGRFFKEID